MRLIPMVVAVFAAVNLSACAAMGVAGTVAGAAGTGAGIAVSVISTTASVAGDVIGVAARTVTGGSSDSTPHDK